MAEGVVDAIRQIIREKAHERELSLSWLSRRIGRNVGYLHDFIEKKTPRNLPERERRLLAEHLGISEDYLRPADLLADVKEAAPVMQAEGERIEVDDIRDQRLRESVRRELKAAKHGEAWLIRTPLIEAKYPPGTLVIVDVGQAAYENDYVQAEIWRGKEKSFVFRKYIPPNLVAAVVSSPGSKGYTVDRETVNIRGVILIGFR
jgi:hypothetical protein